MIYTVYIISCCYVHNQASAEKLNMETQIVIGIEGVFAIVASVIGGAFVIWNASHNAHKEIREELCDIRVKIGRILERLDMQQTQD